MPLKELERQINGYRNLIDGKRYFNIDVNKTSKEIVLEISNIIVSKIQDVSD